ncbi:unnamed protein product [Rotaria sordida]|uniref:Uncharacterized protein n=1 Tax=Rotaria sordida TaxID=392033 RepID=A0A814Z3X3_9BILA|nr:unnamed protein product [Rotaria sordida]CAF3873371.1 unnamed protein product [Rotaria sordida]
MKVLQNANDVERYIIGQCRIWNIDQRKLGKKIIHELQQSIYRLCNEFVSCLEYVDEIGDLCFLLLVVKQHSDIRQRQVVLSRHKLSKSTVQSGDHENVMIEEGMAFSWLKQRACDDLRLSDEQRNCLMPRFSESSGIYTEKAVTFSCENTKTLQDGVANDIIRQNGKRYLQGLGRILNLSNADGWGMFQATLCYNIEFTGASATEFKQLEFRVGGKNGTATYLLVATNVDNNQKVTVCYAYHHIDQYILDYGGFTLQTADITLDWMRAKSCESLATMLPSNLAPQLIYE